MLYIYIYIHIDMYICVYIYIQREREIERERMLLSCLHTWTVCTSIDFHARSFHTEIVQGGKNCGIYCAQREFTPRK